MGGIENKTLDSFLERKEVRAEIRQQVRDKGFTSVIHFAGAIAGDELADWFMQSASYCRSTWDVDGHITDWNQESPNPKDLLRLCLGVWASPSSCLAPV